MVSMHKTLIGSFLPCNSFFPSYTIRDIFALYSGWVCDFTAQITDFSPHTEIPLRNKSDFLHRIRKKKCIRDDDVHRYAEDYEFYIAIRVLLKSLAMLDAEANLVVIASLDVPPRWIRALMVSNISEEIVLTDFSHTSTWIVFEIGIVRNNGSSKIDIRLM
ncbi:hypothetical protein JHK87_016033 [Glycine soja]|nr:hypothetical protein JHK87_016033 [Glycine soja]